MRKGLKFSKNESGELSVRLRSFLRSWKKQFAKRSQDFLRQADFWGHLLENFQMRRCKEKRLICECWLRNAGKL